MSESIVIGAPSKQGESAASQVKKVFGKTDFPLKVQVENLMPRDCSFPEVPGLSLRHCANKSGLAVKEVLIPDLSTFCRLATSVEQIAVLNRYDQALKISLKDSPKVEPETVKTTAQRKRTVKAKTTTVKE